eukprot:scaffold18145_cov35-Tisochrysis_lutea.AAC.6
MSEGICFLVALTFTWSPILKYFANNSAERAIGPEARSLAWSGRMEQDQSNVRGNGLGHAWIRTVVPAAGETPPNTGSTCLCHRADKVLEVAVDDFDSVAGSKVGGRKLLVSGK